MTTPSVSPESLAEIRRLCLDNAAHFGWRVAEHSETPVWSTLLLTRGMAMYRVTVEPDRGGFYIYDRHDDGKERHRLRCGTARWWSNHTDALYAMYSYMRGSVCSMGRR